jgi:hypothetical protein
MQVLLSYNTQTKLANTSQTKQGAASLTACSQQTVVKGWPTRTPLSTYLTPRQGNSDPFGAFAIPINSRINELMSYTRHYYLPAMSTDATNPGSVISPDDWKECVSLLSDACTAYAHLARVAAFMSQPGRPSKRDELAREALIFTGKGTVLLRKRIEKGVVDHNTLYVMSCFLAAEYYCENFGAAKAHAKILGQLFPREGIAVDHHLLSKILRLDAVLALSGLTRPSFDVEKWVPEVFASYFKPLLHTLPVSISLEAMGKDLDDSVLEDHGLKDIIVRLRQALVLYLLSFADPAFAKFEYKFFIRYVVYVSLARLLHHYLDAESLRGKHTLNPTMAGRAQVQAYISLAAILWVRHVATGDNYNADGDINQAVTTEILDTLRARVEESDWMVSKEMQGYDNARLWAIYVGAYLERALVARTLSCYSDSENWFNVRLADQARAMGLISWESVRERLLLFLHTDVLQPHGSSWFPQLMESSL